MVVDVAYCICDVLVVLLVGQVMRTVMQKTPIVIQLVVDEATVISLAYHAKHDLQQYAAGLLIRTCLTAAAIGCKPHDVPTAAVVHSCTCGL